MSSSTATLLAHKQLTKIKFWGLTSIAALSFTMSCVGLAIDEFVRPKSHLWKLHLDNQEWETRIPDGWIGSNGVSLNGMGEWTYKELSSGSSSCADRCALFVRPSIDIIGLDMGIDDVGYISTGGAACRAFYILSVVMHGLALVTLIIFRRSPTSLALKSITESVRANLPAAVPIWCILCGAFFAIIGGIIQSSFMHHLTSKFLLLSLQLSMDKTTILQIKDAVLSQRQNQLAFLKEVGHYLIGPGAIPGPSAFLFTFAVVMDYVAYCGIFYLESRQMRRSIKHEDNEISEAQLRLLPWHCRILSLRMSIGILLSGLVLTMIGGNVTRKYGFQMNIRFWNDEGITDHMLDDAIHGHAWRYWLSGRIIWDALVLLWSPVLALVVIGSVDRLRFSSKLMEMGGYLFGLRGIIEMVTIEPSPYSPMQMPKCYDEPKFDSLSDFLDVEYCNDLMYSGHTLTVWVPMMIVAFMIGYGPYRFKTLPIICLFACALASCFTIILGHLHYTADVVVAMVITTLITTIYAPVWKLMYSFTKWNSSTGSSHAYTKISPLLEECFERLTMYVKAITNSSNEIPQSTVAWSQIDATHEQLCARFDALEKKQVEILEVAEAASVAEDEILNT